jgi:hypothetical protein
MFVYATALWADGCVLLMNAGWRFEDGAGM